MTIFFIWSSGQDLSQTLMALAISQENIEQVVGAFTAYINEPQLVAEASLVKF